MQDRMPCEHPGPVRLAAAFEEGRGADRDQLHRGQEIDVATLDEGAATLDGGMDLAALEIDRCHGGREANLDMGQALVEAP